MQTELEKRIAQKNVDQNKQEICQEWVKKILFKTFKSLNDCSTAIGNNDAERLATYMTMLSNMTLSMAITFVINAKNLEGRSEHEIVAEFASKIFTNLNQIQSNPADHTHSLIGLTNKYDN